MLAFFNALFSGGSVLRKGVIKVTHSRVSDASGKMQISKVGEGDLTNDMLESKVSSCELFVSQKQHLQTRQVLFE